MNIKSIDSYLSEVEDSFESSVGVGITCNYLIEADSEEECDRLCEIMFKCDADCLKKSLIGKRKELVEMKTMFIYFILHRTTFGLKQHGIGTWLKVAKYFHLSDGNVTRAVQRHLNWMHNRSDYAIKYRNYINNLA